MLMFMLLSLKTFNKHNETVEIQVMLFVWKKSYDI